MNELRQLLSGEVEQGRLDLAALEMARIQFPDLDPEPCLHELNQLASRLGDQLRNFNDGRDFVETARDYLFGELGFHGNQDHFYDPLNSCLNQVLERRTGIPITLSVLYMEIARRLKMPVTGVALPRRFVIRFDDGRYAAFIDPYDGGTTVSEAQCHVLAGGRVPAPLMLRPAGHKQIVMRMLQNLQGAYLRCGDLPRAVDALDLLMEGDADDGARYKLRGMLNLQLKRYQRARSDLEAYLRLTPEAFDQDAVRAQLESIHRWLGRLN